MPSSEEAKLAGVKLLRKSLLALLAGSLLLFAGFVALPLAKAGWSFHVPLRLAGALSAAVLLALGGACTLVSVLWLRKGFAKLAEADKVKYGVGKTGAALVLAGAALILPILTAPAGAVVAWLGLVLVAIAIFRLGEERESTFTSVSAVLLAIPPLTWLGALLLYFALGEVEEALKASPAT